MSSKPNDIIEFIYRNKLKNKEVLSKFISRPAVILDYARSVWGYVTTYRYELFPFNYDKATRKLVLANIIAERHFLLRYRKILKHVNVAIVGLAGSGKTTYTILSTIGALKLMNYDDDTIAAFLDKYVFFDAQSFVKTTSELINSRKWSPVIVVDDIGTQISKYWVHLGEHYWVYLFSILDTIKDWSGVMVVTALSYDSIPKRIRDIIDIVVEAKEVNINDAVLDLFIFYLRNEYASTKRKPIHIDVLPPTARIPDSIWKKMIEIRRSTGQRRISLVEKVIDKLPELEEKRVEKILKRLEGEKNESKNR